MSECTCHLGAPPCGYCAEGTDEYQKAVAYAEGLDDHELDRLAEAISDLQAGRELAELREAAGRVVRETEQDADGHFIVPEVAIGDLANLLPDEDGDEEADDEITPAFRTWLQQLEEDVIQGEYGFEPGEFSVFPDHWRQMFNDGLTPQQAYRRALDAFSAGRDEEDSQRKADWQRIQEADAISVAKARASGLLPTETREIQHGGQ